MIADVPPVGARLDGRVAVVTGAGRGIGASIARTLAAAGAEVVLVARGFEELEAVRERILAAGGRAIAVPTDVSSPEEVAALASAVPGVPSILVNTAGVFGPLQPVADTDSAEWIAAVQTNLFGAMLTCRAFVPGMIAGGWGRILNASSAASLHPPGALNSAYGTSKAALNQFTRQFAAELRGTGVTANVFHPGDVATEMFRDIRTRAAAVRDLAGDNYGPWVDWMEQTGGDDPQLAADLVLRVATDAGWAPNGEFLWIEGGLQKPSPSWSSETSAQPGQDGGLDWVDQPRGAVESEE